MINIWYVIVVREENDEEKNIKNNANIASSRRIVINIDYSFS